MNDLNRKEHIRLRRRMLNGLHEQDIRLRIAEAISNVRRAAWGPVDMTSNPFKRIHDSMSAMYNEEPVISGPTGALEAVLGQLDDVGYWTKMKGVQRDVSALREMLILIEPTDDGITVIQVAPDTIDAEASARDPDKLTNVKWYQKYKDTNEYYYLEYDVNLQVYQAIRNNIDISEEILGGYFKGEAYPFRNALGEPIMPWVIYRAEDTGAIFNSWTGREAVECTLMLGMLYTYFSHIIRNAAWAQRYILNAMPLGADIIDEDDEDGSNVRTQIDADPSSVLVLKSLEGTQSQIGSFSEPVDPAKVMESIRIYEDRAMENILGASVVKNDADIRSGYSLAVSREEQIKVQKAFLPLFRRSDRKMLNMIANMLGYNTSLADWDVIYPAIMTDNEKIAAGLMDAPVIA